MKFRFYIKQLLLLIALYSPFGLAKDFIFDFGGVLVLTDKAASFRQIGMLNAILCSLQLKINPLSLDRYIKSRLFAFLDEVAIRRNIDGAAYEPSYDEKGNKLPLLMNAWLQGHIAPSAILKDAEQTILDNPEWFKCQAEERIIRNITKMIFTPEIFIKSQKISPAGVAFIKKCKNEGHRVYGLSNWDAESFALLKKQYPELFDLFDGIVVSGEVKANKPHANIYQILLNRYQLKPENCWFIDDQQENIDGARKLGINAVRHTSSFPALIKNIKLAYSKSLSLPKDLSNNGISDKNTKNANNAIIEGEKISFTDSTKYNCPPANA
jgi:HAD superfamily hydrolase (TIGR01509 family)